MKIKIQITIESDAGNPAVLQEVAQLDRGRLRPETLGLTLAEVRSILAGIEQTVVEQQAAKSVLVRDSLSGSVGSSKKWQASASVIAAESRSFKLRRRAFLSACIAAPNRSCKSMSRTSRSFTPRSPPHSSSS